jgi:hypothetical protein
VTAIRGPSGKLRLPKVANERKTVEGRVTLTDADFEPCTPKETLRHFQSIADWGACRKTPVAAENHHLEAQESCRAMAIAAARPRIWITFRAEPYQAVAPAEPFTSDHYT